MTPAQTNPPTFQELVLRLQTFWADRGCVLQQPYDVEVGAGTMAPETFLRVLGPKPYKVAYVQPSRRPADGRYGENPNRLFKHMQLQVILKPPPENVQELYLESLSAIGIDLRQHDIKFEEDNWESPTLGAWGIGWQVMLDGLEITQFTYFQQCGGVDLNPISAELTYGLERIAAFLQDVDSIYDIVWARDPESGSVVKYGDVRLADELQFSVYNFEAADVQNTWKHFELCESECKRLIEQYPRFETELRAALTAHDKNRIAGLIESLPSWNPQAGRAETSCEGINIAVHAGAINTYDSVSIWIRWPDGTTEAPPDTYTPTELWLPFYIPPSERRSGHADPPDHRAERTTWGYSRRKKRFPLLGAYDLCLKCSHLFNILDARGAISVTERVGVIARVRALAVGIAKAWVDQQKDEPESAKEDGEPAGEKNLAHLSPVGS
ncbi:MAG TPA: glycine--tRNA ligase subunit alpha [Candidatus Sulfotelmatobacter sp.]|nr:glycine--tRNA ligase subunit alpha [Candidatus Sulfotelmatobacter sp.]